MENFPRVSVVTSVYNGEKYIAESVSSILNQTFTDFELVIINDGSTDSTQEILLSFADERIRLIDNLVNRGQAFSLNRGLSLARGEFIARQDADDVSELTRLQEQVRFLDANPGIALLGSGYSEIDADSKPLGECRLPTDCLELAWGLLFHTPFLHSSVVFRRIEVMDYVGNYNDEYALSLDHELWSRVARDFMVSNLDMSLVRYRLHEQAVSASRRQQQLQLLNSSCLANISYLRPGPDTIDEKALVGIRQLLGYSDDINTQSISLDEIQHLLVKLNELVNSFVHHRWPEKVYPKYNRTHLLKIISRRIIFSLYSAKLQTRAGSLRLLIFAWRCNPASVLLPSSVKVLLKIALGR